MIPADPDLVWLVERFKAVRMFKAMVSLPTAAIPCFVHGMFTVTSVEVMHHATGFRYFKRETDRAISRKMGHGNLTGLSICKAVACAMALAQDPEFVHRNAQLGNWKPIRELVNQRDTQTTRREHGRAVS